MQKCEICEKHPRCVLSTADCARHVRELNLFDQILADIAEVSAEFVNE